MATSRGAEYCASLNEGRYQQRRHTHAKPIETEALFAGVTGQIWCLGGRRSHMVVAPAVFIVGNHQQGSIPVLATADRLPHRLQESFPSAHVMGWMFVVRPY